jgi:hypothetical protein
LKGLGRGLDALLADRLEPAPAGSEALLSVLPVAWPQAGRYQLRTRMDERPRSRSLLPDPCVHGVMRPDPVFGRWLAIVTKSSPANGVSARPSWLA